MKNSISKLMMVAAGIAIALTISCTKSTQDEHSVIDLKDLPVLSKLKTEWQNAQSYNDSMLIYQDSAIACADSAMLIHCQDMIHHYDSLYHHAETLCDEYHDQLNEIHHCDMMTACEAGMTDMMRHENSMGNHNHSDAQEEHACSVMEDIKDYCTTTEETEQEHDLYCPSL